MNNQSIVVNPFELLNILDIKIFKSINDHLRAEFAGIILPENREKYLNLVKTMAPIKIYSNSFSTKTLLISGILEDISIKEENDLFIMSVKIVSRSILMDQEHVFRTYQRKDICYEEIFNDVSSAANCMVIAPKLRNESIDCRLIQYKETDWEFFKRISAFYNMSLIADYRLDASAVLIGIPKRKAFIINCTDFTIKKNVIHQPTGEKKKDWENYSVVISKIFSSRKNFELGDNVIFNGESLFVREITTHLVGGELISTYILTETLGSGQAIEPSYNIVGASFLGIVTEVRKNDIKINLSGDCSTVSDNFDWFPFASVYTTSNGSGWYFMPEIGEQVRLFCPNEKTSQIYAISNSYSKGFSEFDHNTQAISTKLGQSIVFSPNSIKITNTDGSSISLDEDSGIMINSKKAVQIHSDESLLIESDENINIKSNQQLVLSQNNTSITIDEDIIMNADKIRMKK